jgi:hypothetical protein
MRFYPACSRGNTRMCDTKVQGKRPAGIRVQRNRRGGQRIGVPRRGWYKARFYRGANRVTTSRRSRVRRPSRAPELRFGLAMRAVDAAANVKHSRKRFHFQDASWPGGSFRAGWEAQSRLAVSEFKIPKTRPADQFLGHQAIVVRLYRTPSPVSLRDPALPGRWHSAQRASVCRYRIAQGNIAVPPRSEASTPSPGGAQAVSKSSCLTSLRDFDL